MADVKVLEGALERRDAMQTELDEIEAGLTVAGQAEPRDLTPEEEQRTLKLLKDLDDIEGRIRDEARKVKRDRKIAEARRLVADAHSNSSDGTTVDAAVTDEPMVYGEGSPNSYFADFVRCSGAFGGVMYTPSAGQRMAEWAHQVEREVANDSKLGRQAVKQLREQFRTENGVETRRIIEEVRDRGRVAVEQKQAELRTGITTGGGATASASGGGGAAFVTPVFFVSDYAPYREVGRAFADQANKQPLPDYGMNVYMPAVTGGVSVAQQTEGSGVSETDPSLGYISGALITEAGEVTVTQQLLDRAGPNFSFDRLIFDQLQRDYAPKVDTYVLDAALTAPLGLSTNWTGNSGAFDLVAHTLPGSGGFYGQVSNAKAKIRTTAGTVLNPTHLFMDPARWEYIAAWADVNGRQSVVPDYAGPFNAAAGGSASGDVGIEGATGFRFNGLPVFTDHNIPSPATGNDQALVADMAEIYFYEGPQVPRVIPQTLAQNLQVLLQLFAYMTVIVRYPSGVYTILGTGMATITYAA